MESIEALVHSYADDLHLARAALRAEGLDGTNWGFWARQIDNLWAEVLAVDGRVASDVTGLVDARLEYLRALEE